MSIQQVHLQFCSKLQNTLINAVWDIQSELRRGQHEASPQKTSPARWGSDPHSWWLFEQRCDIESWASVGPAVRILPCATLEERRKKTRPHKWRQSLIFLEIKILVLFRELVRTVEPTLESMYIVAWYVNTCICIDNTCN